VGRREVQVIPAEAVLVILKKIFLENDADVVEKIKIIFKAK